MTSQTQSYTYAGASDAAFTFSPVVVTETDTVPALDFSGLASFLPVGTATPPQQTAGVISTAPGYDGLTWTPFSSGSFAPGDSVVVTFSYTVTSNIPTQAISSIAQAMTIDYVSGGSYVTGTIATTLTNNGNVVGQSTATIDTPSVTNVALTGAYATVQVSVTMTFSVAANAPVGAAIAVSKLAEGYGTTTVVPVPGSIGDFVWNDLNGDGIYETGEAAMSGVTVDLLSASGAVVAVTTTDATGHYLFSGVNPGAYQVQFVAPFGYSYTSQVAGNGSQTVSAANAATGKTGLITLGAGQNILVEDAGLVFGASGGGGGGGVGTVTTHVYFDTNGDSSQGVGETNLAGVTVSLLDSSGAPTGQTAVTDANGNVSFAGLAPGNYQISVTPPTGDLVTQHTNVGTPITVVANQTIAAVEGLTIAPAALTTHVYADLNSNSLQDLGEGGISGVTVALLNGSGVPTGQTAVTDASGNVSFLGLAPGSYQVAVTTPAGDIVTQHANVGTTLTLAAGQTLAAVEGLYVPATFNTHVYLDSDGNGVQSGAAETNLAGVTVALLNASGVATGQTAVTDANGNVSFVGLAPGGYQVAVTTPNGDVVTQHTNTLTTNNLVAGQVANAIEGVYAPATFNTHVYLDANGDSTQAVGEGNLAGVTVALLNGSGVPTGRTAVTDANGNVSFTGLAPGSYQVAVTTPAGDIVTQNTNTLTTNTLLSGQTANAIEGVYAPATFNTHVYLDANGDSAQAVGEGNLAGVTVALLNGSGVPTGRTAVTDANGNVSFTGLAPGSYQVAVTTPAGDIVTQHTNTLTTNTLLSGQTANAIEGVYAPATFNTHVYLDANGDSAQAVGEGNLAGVTVALLNGSGVPTGRTAVTDANGNVSFTGLAPGSYQVAVTTPAGDIVTQNTNTLTTNTLASGQTANAIEGVYVPATFNTHVYFDSNADGSQGSGETNLAGVTVALLNGSGVPTGRTAVTDANGNVSFAGLAPGSYEVAVTTPAGNIVKQATNVLTPTTLTSGQTASAVEGLYTPATFTTHVFFDTNANATQDAGDTNLAGVTVALLNGSGVPTGQTAVTDANGNVSFTGLVPGSYEVAVTTPAGDTVTTTSNVMTPTTLLAGQTATAIEGLTKPATGTATFTTHVYYDTNKDGVQSGATETNLAGVTVTLLTGTGASTGKTAVTNAAGNVSFAGLAPGSYEVAVTTPAGDVVTKAVNVGTPNTLAAGGSATAIEGVVAGGAAIIVDKTASVNAVKAVDGTANNSFFSTVTYTYKVTNTGNQAVDNIKLVDNHGNSVIADNITPTAVLNSYGNDIGDTNNNGRLDVGETWTYQATVIESGNYASVSSTSASTTISNCSASGGETIWLHSVLSSYQTTNGTSYAFKGVTANVHLANGTTQNYSVPDSYVTFSSACTKAVTTWDAVQHAWLTTLPAGCNPGNVFMTGVPITVPVGTNMKGATVTMTVGSATSSNGASAPQWKISTGAYDDFKTSAGDDCTHDYSCLNVKSCDSGTSSGYCGTSTDKAGTCGAVKDNVTPSCSTPTYGWVCGSHGWTWSCTGYTTSQGSGNVGNCGFSTASTITLTAAGNSSSIDNVVVTAQTVCGTGCGTGCGTNSYGCGSYGGGYSGGCTYTNSYGCGSNNSYGSSCSTSYTSCGYGGSYGSDWCNGGSSYGYSSGYNCSGNYGQVWDDARACWTDDKTSYTGYNCDGTIDDREVSCGYKNDTDYREDDYRNSCPTNGGTSTGSNGCVVTTVTASDMQNVQILANSNIQLGGTATTGELKAAYGAATKLEFTYNPSDVVSASNLQNGIAQSNGHNTDSLAFIEVTNSNNPFATGAKTYFAGTVATGSKFIADASVDINNNLIPGGALSTTAGQNLYVYVFADQNAFNAHAGAIQTIVYDTTGANGGMHINDQIGSIKLAGYVGASGYGYLAA